ncbi:MAG: MFS transporter [Victivallales bacterium]|nr:MFS transporter [Victivallales bacterium]
MKSFYYKLCSGRRFWIFISMVSAVSAISIHQNIMPVLLPRIQRELDVTNFTLCWIVNSFLLAFAGAAVIGGRLADIYGRKRIFCTGIVFFIFSTLLGAFAANELYLILANVCKGLSAALFSTAACAIILTSFDEKNHGKIVSCFWGFAAVVTIVFILTAGFITQHLSWRFAFCVPLPLAVTALAVAVFKLPETKKPVKQRLDIVGIFLLMSSILCMLLALLQFNQTNYVSLFILASFGIGLLFLFLFILLEWHIKEPLINFQLFRSKPVYTNILILFLIQFSVYSVDVFDSIYIQNILHFSPFGAGIMVVLFIVIIALTAQIGGYYFDKSGVRTPVIAGLLCLAPAYIIKSQLLVFENIYYLLPCIFIIGMGYGLAVPSSYTGAITEVPEEHKGQAAGFIEIFIQFGSTFGLAFGSAVTAGIETVELKSLMNFKNINTENFDILSGFLSDTVDVQQTVAEKLNVNWAEITAGLKSVFIKSYSISFLLAGGVAVTALVLAVILFRKTD